MQNSTAKDPACKLCGLPTRGRTDGFCCLGCAHAFEILKEMLGVDDAKAMRKHEFFRKLQDQGIIPSVDSDLPVKEEESPLPPQEERDGFSCVLHITGMWCPSCSWVIEQTLLRKAGILSASASFSTDRVRVTYQPEKIGTPEIIQTIRVLGYGTIETEGQGERERTSRRELIRLGISVVLTVNVMMISAVIYHGFFMELSEATVKALGIPVFLMATAVVSYGGYPIVQRALGAARQGHFVMETLISIGMLAAYGLGVYALAGGDPHMYFDTASMLVTLILLGKFLEARIRDEATRGVEEIFELMPAKARIRGKGTKRYVSIEALTQGDVVYVKEGETLPVDGIVLTGKGVVDESRLTGESMFHGKGTGEAVLGGSTLISGDLEIETTGVGSSSSIGRMVCLMEDALLRKSPVEHVTDRLITLFVPAVIGLALSTGVVLMARGLSVNDALLRMITVLVIACPCALGIATPLARVATLGRARREGILVRNAEVFERSCRLTAMVLDKTGTATVGAFEVTEIRSFDERTDQVLGLAAALEAASSHPIARAIQRRARCLTEEEDETPAAPTVCDVEEIPGKGIQGDVQGQRVLVGSESLMKEKGAIFPDSRKTFRERADSPADTTVYVARGGEVCGVIALGDSIRPGMLEAVSRMRRMGMRVELVSGDAPQTTAEVGLALEVDQYVGGVLPDQKVQRILDLKQEGHCVGMVGDGANDAAALAVADVGFATGDAISVTRNASDVTILSFSGARLFSVFRLAQLASRTVRINLVLAFLYNVIAIPAAVAGLLNPIIAVCAMLLSSLTVVTHSALAARSATEPQRSSQKHA